MFQHQGEGDYHLKYLFDLLSVVYNKLPVDGTFMLKIIGVDIWCEVCFMICSVAFLLVHFDGLNKESTSSLYSHICPCV